MTIPFLTIVQSEPARSQAVAPGNARPEPRSDADHPRKDEGDFAAAMSEGAQDTRTEPARYAQGADGQGRADPASLQDPFSEERAVDPQVGLAATSGEDTAAIVSPEAPRRQVTIPDLPAKRGTVATSELPSPETVRGSQAAGIAEADMATLRPVPAGSGTADGAARSAAQHPAKGQTARDETAPPRAASANVAVPNALRAEAQATTGTASPDAAAAPSEPEEAVPSRLQTPAEAGQRSGMAPPVAQAVRANVLSRAASHPAEEDRMASRARDPMVRTTESVAATPTPVSQMSAAPAPVQAQSAMLQFATRDATTAKNKAEPLLSPDGESEGMRFDLRGASGSTSTHQGSFASALTQTHLPRGLAMQLGDIVRAMPDRPVEVALSPEELGRVRLSISTSEGGVVMHVLAERPETLDLMRRHAEQLARELADLGFGSIDLAFGQGRDSETGEDEASGDAKGRTGRTGDDTDTAIPAEGPVNRMTLSPSGGLDIRI